MATEYVEAGNTATDDPSLKDRTTELTTIRNQARADAERTTAAVNRLGPAITAESLQRFAAAARRKLRNEDGTYRRTSARWRSESR